MMKPMKPIKPVAPKKPDFLISEYKKRKFEEVSFTTNNKMDLESYILTLEGKCAELGWRMKDTIIDLFADPEEYDGPVFHTFTRYESDDEYNARMAIQTPIVEKYKNDCEVYKKQMKEYNNYLNHDKRRRELAELEEKVEKLKKQIERTQNK